VEFDDVKPFYSTCYNGDTSCRVLHNPAFGGISAILRLRPISFTDPPELQKPGLQKPWRLPRHSSPSWGTRQQLFARWRKVGCSHGLESLSNKRGAALNRNCGTQVYLSLDGRAYGPRREAMQARVEALSPTAPFERWDTPARREGMRHP